jgi:hypothetical protein
MDQFFAALFGAVVGGIIAIFGSFKLDSHQRNKRRDNLRAAISVEIASIVELVRRQQYAEHLRGFAARVIEFEAGKRRTISLPVRQSYFTVYEQNAVSLGELESSEVVPIVGFYQQARSILDSVLDTEDFDTEISNSEVASYYAELANYVDNLCEFGEGLVGALTTPGVRERIASTAARLIANKVQPALSEANK